MYEIKIFSEAISKIKLDLIAIIENLKGNTLSMKSLDKKIQQLKENIVPDDWIIGNVHSENLNLLKFIKIILIKQDFLYNMVYNKKCEIIPVFELNKMMDPFSLFINYLWFYSTEYEVRKIILI